MNLTVAQHSEYVGSKGKDWWKWAVWIDGPREELDELNFVEYFLHPTFPNPVKQIRDRGTQFRLDASGWGGFRINVTLHFKDGSREKLSKMLQLWYPTDIESDTIVPDKSVNVILSVSIDQQEAGVRVARYLENKGIKVHRMSDLNQNVPWEIQLTELIENASAFIAVLGPKGSTWVEREIQYALKSAIPIIPILIGDQLHTTKLVKEVQFLRIDSENDIEESLRKLGEKTGAF